MMLIYMFLDSETEESVFYRFHDGAQYASVGRFRIDKKDIDMSEILTLPSESSLTKADVMKGIAKVIRLAYKDGIYPDYVTRFD